MTDPVINIEDLSFTYPDGSYALKSVSLRIMTGEKVVIAGANGAGKSTLVLQLNGLLRGEGKVTISEWEMKRSNYRKIRAKVGVVFQNPDDQLFCPTLYDDIAFGPQNLGLPADEVEARVEEALKISGLSDLAEKNSLHLSYGQKKLAAFASVYSMKPEILVLDEPFSSLDPRAKRGLREIFGKIESTMLIVSHDLTSLQAIADRLVILQEGRIIADGAYSEIISQTALLERAGLI